LGAQRRLRRVYSGPDVGTTFPLKAATTAAAEHPLPVMTLTRGVGIWLSCLEDKHSYSCKEKLNIKISGPSTCKRAPNGS
jgi:hypothetical protein